MSDANDCPLGYGHGGHWCGPHTNCWLDPRPKHERGATPALSQPQASAAQSAPDAHERWLSDPNNEPFPGGLSGIPVPALQSAPAGEREAFSEKMRSRGGLVGWMLGWNGERYEYQPTQDCWEYFQAGAAWQRAQSAPVVPEGWFTDWPGRRVYAAEPHGFDEPGLHLSGASIAEHWQPLYAAAPQPAPREWPVVHTSVGCIACEGSPAGDNNPCHICGATQPAAPVAECTNEDSWNCKYCRKTETCAALKDERNFGAPPKAARQEQGDEVRRLRELLREADDWVRVLRTQFGYAQTKNLAERIDAALSASAEGK